MRKRCQNCQRLLLFQIIQGVPKKISLKLIFEYLSMGWIFLEVIFDEKTFLFYKIFLVSKQNFEKMAPIWWNIVKNITSVWLIQFPKSVKCFKKSYYQFLMINLSKIIDFNDILTYFTSFWSLKNHIEAIFVTIFQEIGAIFSKFCLDTKKIS